MSGASTTPMITVYDGQTALGFIIKRRAEYEAYDREQQSLGHYPTVKAAADAISDALSGDGVAS
jgi:hypothetical protein